MIGIYKSENKIVIKRNYLFMVIGTAAVFMSVGGVLLIFSLLPLPKEHTFSDIFGLFFVCAWTLILLCIGIYAIFTNSKQVTINDIGVSCSSFFTKSSLEWKEIKDFGLSYCGYTRGEGNTYYLYFSRDHQPIKNECKKKLKGKMIKIFVLEGDYEEMVKKIIPFCALYTQVEPFV